MIHDKVSSEMVEVIRRRHESQSLPAGVMTASQHLMHKDRAALLAYIDQLRNASYPAPGWRPDDGTRAGTMGTVTSSQTPMLPTARLTLLELKVEELGHAVGNVHVGVLHETVVNHEKRLLVAQKDRAAIRELVRESDAAIAAHEESVEKRLTALERAVGEADILAYVRQMNELNAQTLSQEQKIATIVTAFNELRNDQNDTSTRLGFAPDREELDRLTGRVTQLESRQQKQAEYIRDAEREVHLKRQGLTGASWRDSTGALRVWRCNEPIPDDMPGRIYQDIMRNL